MLLTLFGTGMFPGEIGQITVADYMASDGLPLDGGKQGKGKKPRDGQVRAEIAFNGRPRPLYWANRKLTAAIDEYLTERLKRGLGTWGNRTYRGLDPASPLFLGRGSEGFTFRETVRQGKVYRQYASVSQLYSKLFRKAGIEGAGAGSARRTLAVKLYRQNTDVRVIAEILGNVSLTAVRKMCEGDTRRLADAVAGVL